MIDFPELTKRVIKYLILGLAISICAVVVPKKALNVEEVVILALSGACIFSVLDFAAPSIGESARNGAGLGLGLRLSGFAL